MSGDYDFAHDAERATIEHDPSLGRDDVSRCLPGWIKTLCEASISGSGYALTPGALNALLHTLIAARARQHRLIRERDEAQ
jgi:hypothetical protein